jgi:hypothetical protein
MLPQDGWRVALVSAYGSFHTSHVASCPDVAPECATTPIPDHKHIVTLDLLHLGLVADYGVTPGLTLELRVPYDIKMQEVRYTTLDGQPFDPPYGDIHHRTENLDGIGDVQLMALFPVGPVLAGAGLSAPSGGIVPNPIELGREGLEHEHIQFGSGTVDPLLYARWSSSFWGLVWDVAADAQIPLYENREGFKAPFTMRYRVGPTLWLGATNISAEWAGQYQSIGRWDGEIDEGTGFHNGGMFLRASFLPWKQFRITPSIYWEVYSKSLSDQSFSQGTTYALTLTKYF